MMVPVQGLNGIKFAEAYSPSFLLRPDLIDISSCLPIRGFGLSRDVVSRTMCIRK